MHDLIRDAIVAPRIEAPDLSAFWEATSTLRARCPEPLEWAIASGARADRTGYAFAAGYQAALNALVGELGDRMGSFCVTEAEGNHPRAISTRLEREGTAWSISGKKRFSTMAPVADVLFVAASEGVDDAGRNRLRLVRIDAVARGIRLRPMSELSFVPEVPHADLELDRVIVDESALLAGDGYSGYVKPFRTVEDIHVHAALLGYVLGVSLRFGWPKSVAERLIAQLAGARELARAEPARPETHVALAGWLETSARILSSADQNWDAVEPGERTRYERDRDLSRVASRVRETRRERAWQALDTLRR